MKRMIALTLALVAPLFSGVVYGLSTFPTSGQLRIIGMFARDAIVHGTNTEGFFIYLDGIIPAGECSATAPFVHVPKKPGGVDNPFYRDLYNTAALALTLQKPINITVHNCSAGLVWPRGYAIDILP